jgi:hypothetical protein
MLRAIVARYQNGTLPPSVFYGSGSVEEVVLVVAGQGRVSLVTNE